MKTWVWVVIGGVALGLFLMYHPNNQLPSTRPAKTKPTRPSAISSSMIRPVSEEPMISGHYNCNCINDVLGGPGCGTATGKSCSKLRMLNQAAANCECIGSTWTGVGCPAEISGTICQGSVTYDKPAHIHTKCLPGEMVMEGGGCVKAWDNPDRYSNQTAAV